jgi:hypothetical protein
MEPKISPSDLRKQAHTLIAAGRMPSLDELLTAVGETRATYTPLILAARNEIVIRLDETEAE